MNFKRPVLAFAFLMIFGACSLKESIVWLKDPLDAEEHVKLGAIYESEGKLDLAEEQYLLALKKDRSRATAWAGLGNIQMAKGRPDKAVKRYSRALGLEPDSPDVLNNFALAALASGKLDDAEEAAEKAVMLDGENLHYYLDTRGRIRLESNDNRGAIEDFCGALKAAPEGDESFRKELISQLEKTGGNCRKHDN